MALAAHVRQYLPPKRIQQMEADLANLACVWDDTRFAGPWGWSLATKQRYKQMGVPVEQLPSDEWLEGVRRLSSREFACRYIKDLLDEFKDPRLIGEEMRWVDKNDLSWSMLAEVVKVPSKRIFKSPWSSSGRGVFVATAFDAHTQQRLQGFLSSQGGFVMDRFYTDKVLDFAMEFYIHEDHTVEFLGYSVFHAAENGAYGYNYVESQEDLLERIVGEDGMNGANGVNGTNGKDGELLARLVDYHKEHLSSLTSQVGTENAQRVGRYYGPVGIDMLKTADGYIHPCLEMNSRMNMGILALLLHEKYGSGATVSLTPACASGYRAMIDKGRLMIAYEK